jgi:hypothetical protein
VHGRPDGSLSLIASWRIGLAPESFRAGSFMLERLPGGGLHPLENAALSRRTPTRDIAQACQATSLPAIQTAIRLANRGMDGLGKLGESGAPVGVFDLVAAYALVAFGIKIATRNLLILARF